NAGTWRWMQDYVYRDGTMLASRVRFDDGAIGVRDYVVDHLGTPRLIGDRYDGLRTQHFFGFGEPTDLASSISAPERKRFTGHERDLGTLAGGGVQVELDYMRARFCSPWAARFLSVDPARESARPQRPQTWNRYSYAFNNPVTLVDPDGRAAESPWDALNVSLDVASLTGNLVAGNYAGAAVDAAALAIDFAALLTPFVPGGAGVAVKAARSTDKVVDASKATSRAENNATRLSLQKQLTSEQQISEVIAGGEAIAGSGAEKAIGDIVRVVRQHGGSADDWAKVTSPSKRFEDGRMFETHAYRNTKTGETVEIKTKIVK
ncbi:MAG: RHS repeat-associated core domain-containing protein, partial [Acidobacteriota bacterium]